MNVISISNLSISYDIVLSLVVASFVLLLVWFILSGSKNNNKSKEHDEKLFKQPPPNEDCPICFLRLPTFRMGRRYMTCCGKSICSGCSYAPIYDDQGNKVDVDKQNQCQFCRTLAPYTMKEAIERERNRMEVNDAEAIYNLGCYYQVGRNDFSQDYDKALELFYRAAELGHIVAYTSIGHAYQTGKGVEIDMRKANQYYELAAMGGHATARYNLGVQEGKAGNMERAMKHFMIATKGGDTRSLKEIQIYYSNGHATKEDYTKALQLYQTYLGEIKSDQRDKAAAYKEGYRYY